MWRQLAVGLTVCLFLGTMVQRSHADADADYDTGLTSTVKGDIRLVDGQHSWEGRLEIYLNGQWGTVCDDNWEKKDAMVACRQLGLNPHYAQVSKKLQFGEISEPMVLDDVECEGNEARLTDCEAEPVGTHDCNTDEAAGVSCAPRVSCDFEDGDLCNWKSETTPSHALKWGTGGTRYGNRNAHLDVDSKPDMSSGILFSPLLNAWPGHTCRLSFVYYIMLSNRCRLTLLQLNASSHEQELWTSTTASEFSSLRTTAVVDCSQENYMIVFRGERLDQGVCGDWIKNNKIDIDDISFNVKPDPTTTTTTTATTTTLPATPTTSTTTTAPSTSAEQDTPTTRVGPSGRTDASSGTPFTDNNVDNKALTDDETGGLDLGVIVVIVVIVVVLIVVAVVLVVVICRRKGGGIKGQGRMTGCFKGVRNRPAASEGHATGAVANRAYMDVDEHFQGAAANTEGDNSGDDPVYRNVPQNLCRNSNTSHAPEATMDVRNSDHRHTGNNPPPTRPHPKATHAGTSQSPSPDEDTSYNHLNTRPVTTDDSSYNHLNTRPVTAADSSYNHLNTRPVTTDDSSYNHLNTRPVTTDDSSYNHLNTRPVTADDSSYNHLNTRPVTTDDSSYNHLNTRLVTADDSCYNHLNTRPANARSATPSVPTTDDTYDHASDPHDHQAEDRNHTTRGVQRDSEEYTLTDTTHRNLPAPRVADSAIYEVEEDDDPQPSVSEDAYNHIGVTGGSARTPAAPLDYQETYNHLNANQETYSNLQHNDGMRQDAQRAASSDQYSHT